MRHGHCTITPADVRALARQAMAKAPPWKSYGRLATAQKILDVLLLAAALASSLSAVVKRFAFGFSHETARKAVDANLPALDELTQGLLDALYLFGSRALRRREWVVAIDEHRDPFYGDRSTEGVTGGQKKHGSKYAFGYATAVIVHLRRRYTVGLIALTGGEKPHQIVAALLGQITSGDYSSAAPMRSSNPCARAKNSRNGGRQPAKAHRPLPRVACSCCSALHPVHKCATAGRL